MLEFFAAQFFALFTKISLVSFWCLALILCLKPFAIADTSKSLIVLLYFLVPLLRHYRSLAEFFTRSIRDDCRIISPDCVVSPCDGRVLHYGPVTSETHLEQVKGVTYSLEAFLGPQLNQEFTGPYSESLKQRKEGTSLYHCIIYLAPGDYHRFHSPTSWKPEIRRHFHGELLSVSPKVAKWVPGLFCLNERAAYIGEWEHGFFSFTAVGEYLFSADKEKSRLAHRLIRNSIWWKNCTSSYDSSLESVFMLVFTDPSRIEK